MQLSRAHVLTRVSSRPSGPPGAHHSAVDTVQRVSDLNAFARAVQQPTVHLDLATTLIASVVRPPVDTGAVLRELDRLAATCERTLDGLLDTLFAREMFRGNVDNYADPENSLLDAVVRRRVGIPITLAIVMIEVGRRVDVALLPVSMPGHFLVVHPDSGSYCDPFGRGALLDAGGCRALHDRLFGGRRTLRSEELAPVSSSVVLARVLNNLEQSALARESTMMIRLLEMHSALPSLPAGEYLALAARFAGIGQFGRAAQAAERSVALLDGSDQLVAQRTAAQYWGRTN
jgi:regulator of sirC expression with transglutaminase-like and TPR domain